MKYWSVFCFAASVVLIAGFVSCNQNKPANMQPELFTCDSAVVMFYKEPGNPRFFKRVKVYDKPSLRGIAEDVNGKLVKGKDSCISQGKIYYYGKGDAVYVVYFSVAENCQTLSFIKTAEKYFTRMSAPTKQLLENLSKEATEPAATQ
jgi:hypothetical protein